MRKRYHVKTLLYSVNYRCFTTLLLLYFDGIISKNNFIRLGVRLPENARQQQDELHCTLCTCVFVSVSFASFPRDGSKRSTQRCIFHTIIYCLRPNYITGTRVSSLDTHLVRRHTELNIYSIKIINVVKVSD